MSNIAKSFAKNPMDSTSLVWGLHSAQLGHDMMQKMNDNGPAEDEKNPYLSRRTCARGVVAIFSESRRARIPNSTEMILGRVV